jgi:pimeloyl-ACP methyl ester carboxylesterase
MKIKSGLLRISVVAMFCISVVVSCKKDDNTVESKYFVSKNLIVTYRQANMQSLIDLASISLPELSPLKARIKSDINVYKMVYKTKAGNNEINASGLVCVPTTPGDYPVLSFQNGTNTLFSNAPSVLPTDLNYQLVEIIASMGYVVAIADYPGFGESTNIPHPYLVKEPTVRSLVDFLYAIKEASDGFAGISLKNEYYLLGYSQGGWATMALHKALELDYKDDFTLKGSSCGAGPYDITFLLQGITGNETYPVPAYFAYIVNAYVAYDQFTNTFSDIFNDPYASGINTLFDGTKSLSQINSQLTTSVPALLRPDFITGFATASKFASLRDALISNSVEAWHTNVPLLMSHGGGDTQVDPASTDRMYNNMISAGTSASIIKKVVVPDVDHSDGIIPCMANGIEFINNLRDQNN